jgi:cytochrome c biogenesis protein CcmG, thiol:disulfide interchange protein DsbE
MTKQRLILLVPLAIFLLLGILFWVGLSLDPKVIPSALINKPVPVFALPVLPAEENPEGITQVSNQNITGISLLNVWATWCTTCRVEHEFLNKLKQQGIKIYGINYKDNQQEAEQWIRELHNPYVFSIYDQEGLLGIDLGVYGAPETFIVDKKGMIRYRHAGDVNAEIWAKDIEPLIKQLEAE